MKRRLMALGALTGLLLGSGCQERIPYHFSKVGRVIDSVAAQGLVGIEVACMIEQRDCDEDCDCDSCSCSCDVEYKEHSKTYSALDGHFYIPYDRPCVLFFRDIDEGRNGGWYAERTVDLCSDDCDLLVELTPHYESCASSEQSCDD
ncbi:MAG: hypothetical protein JXR83_01715 [Deltaproteobacteria bacterium]|nr:hypothetical protein [Deltaproteobacteria bacterium]